jgi:hypothetical protein
VPLIGLTVNLARTEYLQGTEKATVIPKIYDYRKTVARMNEQSLLLFVAGHVTHIGEKIVPSL